MYQVFISHSSKDFSQAQAIVRYLEDRGIRCWIAPRDIQPGSSFGSSISAAIPACPIFLPLLSRNYMTSTHVEKELILAENDRSKHIFPMKLEDCPVVDPFDFHFANLQIKNLYQDSDNELADLLRWIGQILGTDGPQQMTAEGYFRKGMELYAQQNYGDAMRCFVESANMGSADAVNMLGNCYDRGHGAPKDPVRAAELFADAANREHPVALFNLGCCYRDGCGVHQNDKQAVLLFQQAAAHGYAEAQNLLAVYYYTGDKVKRNYSMAVSLLEKAAEQNHAAALFNLGHCYENGHGVKKDVKQARELYQKAAELGYESAQKALERLNKPWFLR